MAVLSEKIHSGIVELRTPKGPVYATPSFCQCLYLLWTFRNFRSLPRQVLNHRQQRLIDKLCLVPMERRPAGSCLIGAVENVQLVPNVRAVPEPARSQTNETGSAEIEVSSEMSAPSGSFAGPNETNARSAKRTANFEAVSAPQCDGAEQRDALKARPFNARIAWTRRRLAWTLVAGFSTALAVALPHFDWLRPMNTGPQVTVETHVPFARNRSIVSERYSQRTEQPLLPKTTSQTTPSPLIPADVRLSPPASPSKQPDKMFDETETSTESPPASFGPVAVDRIQIAVAPESFSYPVTPSPTLTGQVRLRVIIAADGTVKDVNVLVGDRVLAGAAVEAVRRWRYRSPEINGTPAEGEAHIAISFNGDDAVSINFLTSD